MSYPQYTVKVSFCVKGSDGWVYFKRSFILPFVPTIDLYLVVGECALPAIQSILYDYNNGFFEVVLKEQQFYGYSKEDLLQRYSCCEEVKNGY